MRDHRQCIDFLKVRWHKKSSGLTRLIIRWDLGLSLKMKNHPSGDPFWYLRIVRKLEIKDQKKSVPKNPNIKIEAADFFRFANSSWSLAHSMPTLTPRIFPLAAINIQR